MKIPFRAVSPDGVPRPIVDVGIDGIAEAPIPCLVDSGSLHNRFGMWIARAAGIDLSGVSVEQVGIGGATIASRTVVVSMTVGAWRWDAPVAFCEPWPWDFGLLGQQGFLHWFVVTIDEPASRLTLRRAAGK